MDEIKETNRDYIDRTKPTESLKNKPERDIRRDKSKRLEELIDRHEPKLEESSVYVWSLSKDCAFGELTGKMESFGQIISCHIVGPRTEEEKVFKFFPYSTEKRQTKRNCNL